MNSLERCMCAMQHKKPDRVPVAPESASVAMRHAGMDYIEYVKKGENIFCAQLDSQRYFGYDGIFTDTDTACMAEAIGSEIVYSRDKAPVVCEPLLKRLEDVKNLKKPNPLKDGRLKEWVKSIGLLAERVGKSVFIIGGADQGPVSLAAELRGAENFMMDLALEEEPELIHELLDFCSECIIDFSKAQKDVGAHVISFGDAYCSPDVISPKMYEKYGLPYQQKVAMELKKDGIPVSLHICGNTTNIIDKMLLSGAECFELDYKIHFSDVYKKTRNKVCILGNVDPKVIASETSQLVLEKCRELIEAVKPDSSFILSSGCNIPHDAPEENIFAMVEAAKMYGNYA